MSDHAVTCDTGGDEAQPFGFTESCFEGAARSRPTGLIEHVAGVRLSGSASARCLSEIHRDCAANSSELPEPAPA